MLIVEEVQIIRRLTPYLWCRDCRKLAEWKCLIKYHILRMATETETTETEGS